MFSRFLKIPIAVPVAALIFSLAVGAVVAVIIATVRSTAAQKSNRVEAKPLPIIVVKQDNSPLLITAESPVTNIYKPSYSFLVTNVGQKSVRAYTVKTQISNGKKEVILSGSLFTHLIADTLLLHPTQSRQELDNGGTQHTEPVTEIRLSIDFVEFVNGDTWGVDTTQSAEVLDGQREGGKAVTRYVSDRIATNVFDSSVIESLSLYDVKLSKAEPSRAWKRGFEMGIGIVRNRVLKAWDSAGIEEVKLEIGKPFDASAGRREP